MMAWLMTTPSKTPAGGAHDAATFDGRGSLDARVSPLAASLAQRLAAVCRNWDAAEFDALVQRIARMKLRWVDQGYGE